jgi:hypothetical protein
METIISALIEMAKSGEGPNGEEIDREKALEAARRLREAETAETVTMTKAEWEAHQAFYALTVKQRDAAWRETELLRTVIDTLEKGWGNRGAEADPEAGTPDPNQLPLRFDAEALTERENAQNMLGDVVDRLDREAEELPEMPPGNEPQE